MTTPLYDINSAWKSRNVTPLQLAQLCKIFPVLVPYPEFLVQVWDYAAARNLSVTSGHIHAELRNSTEYVNGQSTKFKTLAIMPTIAAYRHIAHETGNYAGMDAPIYGPSLTFNIGSTKVVAPEWVELTVYIMNSGVRCPITRREWFLENVATTHSGNVSYIWSKRPAGQLTKCVEAQCLRAGFSRCDMYTPDEMMGDFTLESNQPENALSEGETPQENSVLSLIINMYERATNLNEINAASAAATQAAQKKQITPADVNGPVMSAYTSCAARLANGVAVAG